MKASQLRSFLCGMLSALLMVAAANVHAAPAGTVLAVRGAATAKSPDGTVRVLGRNDNIIEGDVLSTGRKSFAILKFNDGTRMSLRPQTVFQVEQWRTTENQESAVTRLFKGGLRAVTGFIAKRNSRAFRVNTSVATIGIRGTTFDARLCDEDCRLEVAQSSQTDVPRAQTVGRVGFVKGTVTGQKAGSTFVRPITAGSPLYAGDTITTQTGSFAILIFNDRSRVTLRGDSKFVIEEMRYNKNNAEEDSAVFRLVRGGLRAVTGLIGKRNARRVRFRTAFATLGIRGTGFDLVCIDSCGESEAQAFRIDPLEFLISSAHAQTGLPPGLLATPWLNAIYVEVNGRTIDIPEGKVVFIPLATLVPQELPQMPQSIPEPKPDEVEVDEQNLFNFQESPEGDPGLHVACLDGTACVVGDEIVGAGEMVYTSDDGNVVIKSQYAAGFLVNDKYFKTVDVPPEVIDLLYEPGSGDGGGDEQPRECTVQ